MTHQVGEYMRIAVDAKIEEVPGQWRSIVPADVDEALFFIYLDGQVIVDGDEMEHDEDSGYWFYFWDSSGHYPGDYTTRAFFEGEGHRSWENGSLKLVNDKAPVIVR